MITAKFGGTSSANAELLESAKNIMHNNSRYAAVISACGKDKEIPYGVTNLLLRIAGESPKETKDLSQEECQTLLKKRYSGICSKFGYLDLEQKITEEINSLPGKDREYIVSRGEAFSTEILSRKLGWELINPVEYIIIENNTTRQPNLAESIKRLSTLKGKKFVIPGFFGSYNGRITTFNRGGSDLTQALVANALDADLAENFTDVQGIFYADPKILRNKTQVVPETTYREQRELSAMNSKLNEAAIYPLMLKSIPLQVRSSFDLSNPGTLITSTHQRRNGIPIAGVAGKAGTVSMSLYKYRMDEEIGFTRRVLSILEDFNINVQNTPATTDYQGVNFRRPDNFDSIKTSLKSRIETETGSEVSFIDEDLAQVAVVGELMRSTPGILARVSNSLARGNINIITVSQGPSESNIILGINNNDLINAINAIHDEFIKC